MNASVNASPTGASFRAEVDENLARANETLARLKALADDASVETVVLAFDRIGRETADVLARAELFAAVHPDQSVREAAEEGIQKVVGFNTALGLDRDAYAAFARLDVSGETDADLKRYVEHSLRNYRRSGVDKDDATRERIAKLQEELVEVGQSFDRNIMNGGRHVRLDGGHADLAGLPADFLASHPEDDDGSVTLSTDPTDFLPVLLYAESDETRRRMYVEYNKRAFPENVEVLDSLVAKRHELAQLLGFPHWAEYVCEDKMIRTAEAARSFAQGVSDRARPVGEVEYAELLEFLRRREPGAERVEPWQSRFLMEQVKREKHDFDSQSVRPYFAYDRVKNGILRTTETLYGVEIRPAADAEAWHESVETFEVFEGGELIARFHLDMFPRDGKYKHAAQFHMQSGVAGEVIPEAALVCNFPQPKEGDPALLLHEEVTTLFHEFGHLLHDLFAVQKLHGFAGITCEWDFVEVPSQLYEEWAWSSRVLERFATHHETGESIPGELVDRLRAAEEYGKGLGVMTQMLFALYSISLYDRDPKGLDAGALMETLRRELTFFEGVEGTAMQCSFGHLHSYSANYYTYMWSLVIAKDFFGQFEADLFDPGVARRYREQVLAKGGADDASNLVQAFLGRDFQLDAWEAWLQR